jgi:transposase, IS30 family
MARLTLSDRIRLETLLNIPFRDNLGFVVGKTKKIHQIADRLNVSYTTIYRELSHNGFTVDNYVAQIAHSNSLKRISLGNSHYKYSKEQKAAVLDLFSQYASNAKWSPVAFIDRVRLELPDVPIMSHEAIYTWVYEDAKTGGSLFKLLLRTHKRRKRQNRNTKIEEKISDKVSIWSRPSSVLLREEFGDFESDSVVGPQNKAGIITSTERKSRLLLVAKVPSKNSDVVGDALITLLMPHKKRIKTHTTDNGSEFAKHVRLAKTLKCQHYFADPYSSYQRGSNENANGMVRRFFKKGTDFEFIDDKRLQKSVNIINQLPRKIHNGLSAYEVYYGVRKKMISSKHRRAILFAFRS